jgi:hypothetical protein
MTGINFLPTESPFCHNRNLAYAAEMLFTETFLPKTLEQLRQEGGSAFLTVSAPPSAKGVTAINLNATASVADDVLVEITVWPQWSTGGVVVDGGGDGGGRSRDGGGGDSDSGGGGDGGGGVERGHALTAAVGVLCGVSDRGNDGVFAGVTANGTVVLESWKSGQPATLLAEFDLSTLPINQNHAAVNGWNMLRLQITGDVAHVWWNPTHADTPGFNRGKRLSAQVPARPGAGLAAAVRGGPSSRVDYVGVFRAPPQ